MVAKKTYKVLREVLGPWFKSNGFKTVKGSFLIYQKALNDKFVTAKFRCHPSGWDKYKGSTFCAWYKHSPDPTVDDGPTYMLTRYLSLPEREFIRGRQNRIVSNMPAPPPEYINAIVHSFQKTFKQPQRYIDAFLQDWRVVARPYASDEPIWFRYLSEDDVRSWAILILNHMKAIYGRSIADAA